MKEDAEKNRADAKSAKKHVLERERAVGEAIRESAMMGLRRKQTEGDEHEDNDEEGEEDDIEMPSKKMPKRLKKLDAMSVVESLAASREVGFPVSWPSQTE